MMDITSDSLDLIFGPGDGTTPEERARGSEREFVRSLDQIAEASERATGRRLTALEALEAYGLEILQEVAAEGSALLAASSRSAGRLLRERRELLGLEIRSVANSSKVDARTIESAEANQRVSIRQVEKIARALGLDERMVSWKTAPTSSEQNVAIRLRTIGEDLPQMTATGVSAIAEAAWVAAAQLRLQDRLALAPASAPIGKSPDFGDYRRPPYSCGYKLAFSARKDLRLGEDRLPFSLRVLSEEVLGIPVIQSELGPDIAGVTVELGSSRAIVLNLDGKNRNVFVRRSTIAHELCHLMFDPSNELEALRVDAYVDLERHAHEMRDPVEQRANAFAIEFIAPRAAVVERYKATSDDPVWAVMNHFGISHTAARYQIWNGLGRNISLESIHSPPGRSPEAHWDGDEAFTVDYHPLHGLRPSRSGRFSAVVVRAAQERHISWDTAAEMLEVEKDQLQAATIKSIQELFPSVFS